jgi:hypothetical protein
MSKAEVETGIKLGIYQEKILYAILPNYFADEEGNCYEVIE